MTSKWSHPYRCEERILAALSVLARSSFINSTVVALVLYGKNEFDIDAEMDIATTSPQRNQLRGTTNVKVITALVMSN